MIDEYTGKKIVSPLDFLPGRILPDDVLKSLSDEDFNSLWENRKLKPFHELSPHIQRMPCIKILFGL
ncbi:MAG: hypothetical protein WA003_17295 [Desulfuromonadaceae bacterium]